MRKTNCSRRSPRNSKSTKQTLNRQKNINTTRDRTQDAAAKYAQMLADAESLERYNNQLAEQVKSQQMELASIDQQLADIETTTREVQPLMQQMVDALAQFVSLDVPFLLEERIAALEGGVGAIATASGQAALHLAIATLMGAGSHIVASRALYGGSHNLLHYTLPRFGIETTFVDPRDLDAWRARDPARTRGCCSARRSATPGSTCSTSRASRRSRTSTACRCWSTRRSPRRS